MTDEKSAITFFVTFDCCRVAVQRDNHDELTGFAFASEPAGIDLLLTLVEYLRNTHHLLIGRATAHLIIQDIGSALPLESELPKPVTGRSLISGLPARIEMSSIEVREVLTPTINRIAAYIKFMTTLRKVDGLGDVEQEFIHTKQIVLTGEFAHLRKFDQLLQEVTGLHVTVE